MSPCAPGSHRENYSARATTTGADDAHPGGHQRKDDGPSRLSSLTLGRVRRGPQELLSRRRSEEHTSELQLPCNLVCRLLLEKKKCSSTPRIPWSSIRTGLFRRRGAGGVHGRSR